MRNDHQGQLRCNRCGYILTGLPDTRCPECGTEFDARLAADPDFAARLLPWERTGNSLRFRAFWHTCVEAWLRPRQHFARAKSRTQCAIFRANLLTAWSVGAAIGLQAAYFLVDKFIAFACFLWSSGSFFVAADTSWKMLVAAPAYHLVIVADDVAIGLLPLLLFSLVFGLFLRSRLARLKFKSLLALVSPCLVLFQLFVLTPRLLCSLSVPFDALNVLKFPVLWFYVLMAGYWLGCAYVGLVVGLALRHLCSLPIRICGLIAIAAPLAMYYGGGRGLGWLLWRALQ